MPTLRGFGDFVERAGHAAARRIAQNVNVLARGENGFAPVRSTARCRCNFGFEFQAFAHGHDRDAVGGNSAVDNDLVTGLRAVRDGC